MEDFPEPTSTSPDRWPIVVPAALPPPRERAQVLANPELTPDLINLLLRRSGLSQSEVARRLGQAPQSIYQYRAGYRDNPSLFWFVRFAQVCGAKVIVELPDPF